MTYTNGGGEGDCSMASSLSGLIAEISSGSTSQQSRRRSGLHAR
jgi:hypothetical protein